MHIPTTTLVYLVAIFGLLVVPGALQRFRLPTPLYLLRPGNRHRHLLQRPLTTRLSTSWQHLTSHRLSSLPVSKPTWLQSAGSFCASPEILPFADS